MILRLIRIVLTDRFVQDDSCLISRGEFSLANRAWFRATDPYSISDLKAVCVLGQDNAGIYAESNSIFFEI